MMSISVHALINIQIMSKAENFLNACKDNVGKWTCSLHTTGSNQPAAIFREVKKQGYEFEETAPNRWAKKMFCPLCNQETTHYKLLSQTPTLSKHKRLTIDKESRERALDALDWRDAFTGAKITSTPEIDHKTPWTRLEGDIDIRQLSDAEIVENFQLLTREHNLLKDRMCSECKKTNIRPPFLGISYWYEGGENYCGTCVGCGWHDGAKWREAVDKLIRDKHS